MSNKGDTSLSTTNILNRSYDPGLDVIVVETIGADGVLKNPATEETLQAVLSAQGGSVYNYIQSATDATYKYYGYASSTGWKFKRKTLSTGVWEVSSGSGDFDTNWADKNNKIYLYV